MHTHTRTSARINAPQPRTEAGAARRAGQGQVCDHQQRVGAQLGQRIGVRRARQQVLRTGEIAA